MFLVKHSGGIYHLIYIQKDGSRTSISTKTKFKSEAYKFLVEFSNNLTEQKEGKRLCISLQKFTNEFLKHSEIVHTQVESQKLQASPFFNSWGYVLCKSL